MRQFDLQHASYTPSTAPVSRRNSSILRMDLGLYAFNVQPGANNVLMTDCLRFPLSNPSCGHTPRKYSETEHGNVGDCRLLRANKAIRTCNDTAVRPQSCATPTSFDIAPERQLDKRSRYSCMEFFAMHPFCHLAKQEIPTLRCRSVSFRTA